MTMYGGHDDARMPPAPIGLTADEPEGAYRQDDAPPGFEPVASMPPADEPALLPPRRSVPETLATLRATPVEFERLISGQSEEALAKPASDGEWGVVEILPHLRDWETIWQEWIHRLLIEDMPVLEAVDDSLWAIEHDYANENVPDVLDTFRERRAETVQLLEPLDEAAWQRVALHPQLGPLTLHQLADRMCDHDARHIEQARDALA
jgi:hypothetical protein